MTIGPASAAASRLAIDQSAQPGSSVTRSSRTLVSTSVTVSVAARQRHDLVRAEPLAGAAAQSFEPALPPAPTDLHQDDAAVGGELEIDPAARCDAEPVAYRL